jgi:hypothetical protein
MMHTNNNIDENWGFYVDIENMKPDSLNNQINIEKNISNYNKEIDNDYYNKKYGPETYNSEIFYMEQDIDLKNNSDNHHSKNNINHVNTVNDILMNVGSATILTAALSCIILLVL